MAGLAVLPAIHRREGDEQQVRVINILKSLRSSQTRTQSTALGSWILARGIDSTPITADCTTTSSGCELPGPSHFQLEEEKRSVQLLAALQL